MNDVYFCSDNFYSSFNEEDNSFFSPNENNFFDVNFFKDEPIIDINSDNNSSQYKNSPFQENSNLSNELSNNIPTPISRDDKDTSKIQNNNIFKLNNSSSSNENNGSTKEKSKIKNTQNSKNDKNKLLEKKRKPRVHLEDIDIDPEIVKNNKFYIVDDKVIVSKNQILSDEDKKEIKRLRNMISAKKNRKQKKLQFHSFKEEINILNIELNKKNLIIEKFEKICCPACRARLMEIDKKMLEDNDINNNDLYIKNESKENEEYVLEEKDSFLSDKKNSFVGKISSIIIGLVSLLGIILIFEGRAIIRNSNKNTNISSNGFSSLRHLLKNTCSGEEEKDINYENEDKESNLPFPVKYFKIDNFLQMCHDKFTFEKSNLKNIKRKKGNLLKKTYEPSLYFENNKIINNNYIINDNIVENNIPVKSSNNESDDKISNKIISVFVKDYEHLKKQLNGKNMALQEQIENEAKNSEDGCVYLQMIIPRETLKNNYDKNVTSSEIENNFFEIRCQILEMNNYYTKGIYSH